MNQYAQFETHTNPMKHSGLGIASFIISLLNGVLMLILVIASAAMVNEGLTENDPGMQLLGVVLLGSVILTMVGGVFGIITCFFIWIGHNNIRYVIYFSIFNFRLTHIHFCCGIICARCCIC